MTETRPVTGGDLYRLWRAANIALPTVRTAYVSALEKVHSVTTADEEKFGRAHTWWAWLATDLEQALFLTNGRLAAGAGALNSAIEAYKYTDRSNSKELSKAGKQLEDTLNDPNLHNKDDELTKDQQPGTPEVPNQDPPDDQELK